MSRIRIPFQVPAQHACFSGHFPGNPIVPGALLLQWLLEQVSHSIAVGVDVVAVSSAKFLTSLKPGDNCEFQFDYQPGDSKLRVTCSTEIATACKAVLVLGAL
jgi:3-hydroxymyristoyl/3-hydroxydecanoyl-(acyl carrier protein) dehydratase